MSLRSASMRPGFYTRKSIRGSALARAWRKASMRPGFYTRKSRISQVESLHTTRGFNEAGILHPEKRRRRSGRTARD